MKYHLLDFIIFISVLNQIAWNVGHRFQFFYHLLNVYVVEVVFDRCRYLKQIFLVRQSIV